MKLIMIALITSLVLGFTAPDGLPAAPIEVVGPATPAETALVDWATGRFAAAGLDLPSTVVEFPSDATRCSGNMAVAVHGTDRPRVVACTDDEAPDVVVRRTLLHELAHIWAHAELDDMTRDAFLSLRGLESWTDAESWSERGSEQAAEIMTWALMDTELRMLTLADHDPAGMAAAYELLTGTPRP